tara:strand:- start:2 stop:283 length:282 start_codon:yes stop_codon:yes gene_type:complete
VLYWIAKWKERKYEEFIALEREAEQKQIEIRARYTAHNQKWTRYIQDRKIALGLALEEDIRDYSHTPITKSANNAITEHDSQQHENQKDSEQT